MTELLHTFSKKNISDKTKTNYKNYYKLKKYLKT